MAMVCFEHPHVPSAGACTQCGLGLCASCIKLAMRHPPVCRRCVVAIPSGARVVDPFGFAAETETELIQHRALAAVLLAGLGTFLTWNVGNLLSYLGLPPMEPWRSMVASHDVTLLALGAYCVGSVPYGWAIAGDWLVPPRRFGPAVRAQAIRSATLAVFAIGPFLAPAGVIHDFRRLIELNDVGRTRRRTARVQSVTHPDQLSSRDVPPKAVPATRRALPPHHEE